MSQPTKEKTGFMANIGKSVSSFASKTQETIVHAVDKNGDGKFDRNDIGLSDENLQAAKVKANKLVSAAGDGIKNHSEMLSKAIADSKLDKERKTLRPVFIEELTPADAIPNMVRIVAHDKRRDESAICDGSVGYWEAVKGIDTLCVYDDCAVQLGICFHPSITLGIFYAEPYQERLFVALDEYFNYLKKARVNELEMIAQKLGAKRVQITFKEQAKNITKRNLQADANSKFGGAKAGATGTFSQAGNEYAGIEIAADLVFSGHDHPEVPELVYFKHETDIEKLIEMRTSNGDNKIQSKTYKLQCNKSAGIKENEAAKIDAVAGQLKCGASQSFSSEVQRENRTELEYKIEF